MEIISYKINDEIFEKIKNEKYINDWPVVYILSNQEKKEAYIGETTNVYQRISQHMKNDNKKLFTHIHIIIDDKFNTSAILYLENLLIEYMSADNKFKLQNGNKGQNHNFYQKEIYKIKFYEIWKELLKNKLAIKEIKEIENTDLFKYSPYKTLTNEQENVVNSLINTMADNVKNNKKSSFLIYAGAGTGKTIVAMYLMKLLLQQVDENKTYLKETQLDIDIKDIKERGDLKIGLVISMDSLRETIKQVVNNIDGLTPNLVLSPSEVAESKEKYDILIVDETHRLKRRKALIGGGYVKFDKINTELQLDKTNGNELDWIRHRSENQIYLYDYKQTIRPTDISIENFNEVFSKIPENHKYKLKTQMRCMGGEEYINLIQNIFSNNNTNQFIKFKNYEFKVFDDVDEMVNKIKQMDDEYGLSRVVSGIAWKNISDIKKLPSNLKKLETKELIKAGYADIKIDGYEYRYNSKKINWVNSKESSEEIGCIHTVQGIDLNYTGVIIGNELQYDAINKKIIAVKQNYMDIRGKESLTEEKLLKYILNIYKVLCTRGIKGTYLYICDPGLREHIKNIIKRNNEENICGFDLGGTNIKCYFDDENTKIIKVEKDFTKKDAIKAVEKFISKLPVKIERIGIACSGFVNENEIFKSPHKYLQGLKTSDFNIDAVLINDANAATYAGRNEDDSVILGITSGTSIGSGLCINHELYTGANFFAGEIDENICYSNGKTKIKEIASGKYIKEEIEKNIDNKIEKRKIIENAAFNLGILISNISNFINPSLVYLSGGVFKYDGYFEKVKQTIKENSRSLISKNLKIELSKYGIYTGCVGAMKYAKIKKK